MMKIIIFSAVLQNALAFKYFQRELPGGADVPNPCNASEIWHAVGHRQLAGAGPNNVFGLDFRSNGFKWSSNLCNLDSDGDGKTNGAELGDPNCTWTRESNIQTKPLSHPGLCEPINSSMCLNASENAKVECTTASNVHCDDIDDLETKILTLKSETNNHNCSIHNLPEDEEYHLISVAARDLNIDYLRILVYGCNSNTATRNNRTNCEHTVESCKYFIAEISPTATKRCYTKNVGVTIGKNGFTKILLQYDRNNLKVSNNKLSVELMYTSKRRRYDIGIAEISSMYFSIPPKQSDHEVTGSCSSICTHKMITSPIFVVFGEDHIGEYGRRQRVEVIREGNVIYTITDDLHDSSKNIPSVTWHDYPLPLLPGDEIKLTCQYDTQSTNTTVIWGKSQNQEICKSYIGYFPSENWSEPVCYNYRDIPLCNIKSTGIYNGCDFRKFLGSVDIDITISTILETCYQSRECSPTCTSLVWNMRRHPCLQGNLFDLWASNLVALNNSRLFKLFPVLSRCYKTRISNFIKRRRFRFRPL